MVRTYSADFWELESIVDSTRYDDIGHCVALLEHQLESFDERNETEHSASFGTIVQSSFLIAAVAQLEHDLKKICDVIAEKRNLIVRTADMKGANGFASCIAYFDKVLQLQLPRNELKVIRGIIELRNSWVHHGGYLDNVPSALGELAQYVDQAADGQLQIAGPFVQNVCRRCQSFEIAVVNAINAGYSALEKEKKKRKRT
jgi:hypothetical protein